MIHISAILNTGIIFILIQSLTHQYTNLSKRFHKAHDTRKTKLQYERNFFAYAIKQSNIATKETIINIPIGNGIHRDAFLFIMLCIIVECNHSNNTFVDISIKKKSHIQSISDKNKDFFLLDCFILKRLYKNLSYYLYIYIIMRQHVSRVYGFYAKE